MIKILDKDKLVVLANDWYPISNDCRLGRSYSKVELDRITW